MISIIIPYFSSKMLEEIEHINEEKEIIVPEIAYKNYKNLIKIKASTLEEFIKKSFKICKGDTILFLGGVTDAKTINRIIEEIDGADIVYLKRKKQSRLAKFFIHLILPASRHFKDPLTQIFAIKREVIANCDIQPVEKLLIEIIARGKYNKIKEIKADAEIKFSRNYRGYSKYVLNLARQQGELARFIKFGIVGTASVIANELILWACLSVMDVVPAGLLAIEGGTIFAFTLNDIWTFRDRGKRKLKEFFKRMAKYHLFTLVGIIINLVVLVILSKFFGIHPLMANITGMALAFIWNFLTNNFIVWSI